MIECNPFANYKIRGLVDIHRIFNVDNAISTKIKVIIQNLMIILGSDKPESS